MPYLTIALSALKAGGQFLARYWKAFALILLAVIVYFIAIKIWDGGYSQAADRYKLIIAAKEAEYAKAVAGAEAKARKAEQKHAADMAAIDTQHQEAINHVAQDRDRTIASLRAGALRLRPQFTCSVSEAATPAGIGDGQTEGGLSAEDAEFFIREASRCDGIVMQLSAAQSVIRADRAPD